MAKPENKVKERVKKICDGLGIFNRAYVATPMTKGGFPDRLCCVRTPQGFGLFLTIECKTKGNKPTPLQTDCMEAIRKCGGLTLVVDETNIEQLEPALKVFQQCGDTEYASELIYGLGLGWTASNPKFEI